MIYQGWKPQTKKERGEPDGGGGPVAKKGWIVYHVGEHDGRYNMTDRETGEERE